jgi:imidazolonepropionase-like amidohydrolase/ABC-type multidrug transport system permease subunit
MKAYVALFKNNLRLTLRDRAVLFFNFAFPLLFFFGFVGLFSGGESSVAMFVGTVLTMGILGNGLWGSGMRAVQEREANILRRFKVTPISPMPILIAAMICGWLLYMPLVATVLLLAHFVYGMPFPQHWISLLALISLGVCAFRAIGLILAAVTNTMQEATVLIQLFYLPMLLLSGATVPAAMLPNWIQSLAEFMPAAYLVSGFQGVFYRNQSIFNHGPAVFALSVTLLMGTFVAAKLFRWEKGERTAPRNKLWVAAALAPCLVIGGYRMFTREHLGRNQAYFREIQRSSTFLIRDARIFTAAGNVIENGSVLVRYGKIAEVYEGAAPDPQGLKAEVVEGAGKTLLPGFVDAHVHLAAPSGLQFDSGDYSAPEAMARASAALLYSGVTAARSTGDGLKDALELRQEVASGARLGAQIFVCGPLFTVNAGHGAEFASLIPQPARGRLLSETVRVPKTPEDARRAVAEFQKAGVDGLKVILEAGLGAGDRLDLLIARSVLEEARARNLRVATHTGDARDVADAVDIGSTSVEHGALTGELPDNLLARMAAQSVFYDPTLSAIEGAWRYYSGNPEGLGETLLQQTAQPSSLKRLRDALASGKTVDQAKAAALAESLDAARSNLVRAWKAGVPLVAGTDAGDPLVFPGASLHRELRLWVAAGIPPDAALTAATSNGAKLLGAKTFGAIRKGLDADLILVDGNPLEDITATERISLIVFKGERLKRSQLLEGK